MISQLKAWDARQRRDAEQEDYIRTTGIMDGLKPNVTKMHLFHDLLRSYKEGNRLLLIQFGLHMHMQNIIVDGDYAVPYFYKVDTLHGGTSIKE